MSHELRHIALGSPSSSDENGEVHGGRTTDTNKATGERIRFARKWAGLNQDEVATRLGLSRASVSNWELGLGIKRKNLVRFAQAVGVSPEWLITGEPTLAPKGEKSSDRLPVLEVDTAQLERLIAAVFELLGKPHGQAQELAKAILKAAVHDRTGAKEPHDEALTKRLAQFLVRMYAS